MLCSYDIGHTEIWEGGWLMGWLLKCQGRKGTEVFALA